MEPFDRHQAAPTELESNARRLERLAEHALDLRTVTDRAFSPAEASWDGVAAPELREAPEPLRRQAEQTSGDLAWGAVPLRYWASQVRTFNQTVDRLSGEFDEIDSVGHRGRNERSRKRREWQEAYDLHIVQGARDAAGMFRDGPTYQNLARAREVGAMPAGVGAFIYFAEQWDAASAPQEVLDLAQRINDGHRPTTEELERMAELMGRYADDEVFAYTLLTSLGPRGLLEFTGNLGLLAMDDPQAQASGLWDERRAQLIGGIQASLGIALATATTRRGTGGEYAPGMHAPYVPGQYELPQQWQIDLMLAGRDTMQVGGPGGLTMEIYGYQALGVLLHRGAYDPSFLALVGGDMVDFEREQGGSDFWDEDSPRSAAIFYGTRLNWVNGWGDEDPAGFDPILGVLDAMSRNTDGARDLFTGLTSDGRLPRVDYLLTDREWPADYVYTAEIPSPEQRQAYQERGLNQLGDILDTATTYRPDERSFRIVESIIYEIANDEQAFGYPNDPTGQGRHLGDQTLTFRENDLIPPVIRDSMANIATAYIDDFHWNMAGKPPPEGMPADYDVNVNRRDLQLFLADLGKDHAARDQVTAATVIYSNLVYDHYLAGGQGQETFEQRLAAARSFAGDPAAQVIGSLDFGSASGTINAANESDTAHNQALRDQYAVIGLGVESAKAAAGLPYGGALTPITNPLFEAIRSGVDATMDSKLHDHTGEVNYQVGDLRERGRDLLGTTAEVAVYRNLTPEQIATLDPDLKYPPDHERAGQPIPPHEWGDDQHGAFHRYLSGTGADDAGAAGVDARKQYDAAYDQARTDLESYVR